LYLHGSCNLRYPKENQPVDISWRVKQLLHSFLYYFRRRTGFFITVINQLDVQKFCFTISLFHASTCFEHYVLIIRGSKLHYTASGIIGFVVPDGCITLIQFYPGVLVAVYLLCLFCITNIDVSLTAHLCIFISVINQLDAQNFCFTISLLYASTCFEHCVLIIRSSKLHYTASGIITTIGVMIPEAV